MLDSSLPELLKIKYPLFQGAMASISEAGLTSAVSEAGGLGVIAAGNETPEWVRDQIRKARSLTKKPFGVNIMLMSPHAEAVAELLTEEKVPVIITGAGNPGKYIETWKNAGSRVIPVVPSVSLARRMEKAGADAVIAEGTEAGGHIGELTTMALIPQVADAVSIPVIAAGGIADGRGVVAAFALGAQGIQVGTAFLVADECTVHENYKEKILKAKDTDTTATGRSSGHPVRVIKNKLARKFSSLEKSNAPAEELEALGRGSLYKAAVLGDMEQGSIMAGQIAGLISRCSSCREIIEEMFNGADKVMLKLNSSDQ